MLMRTDTNRFVEVSEQKALAIELGDLELVSKEQFLDHHPRFWMRMTREAKLGGCWIEGQPPTRRRLKVKLARKQQLAQPRRRGRRFRKLLLLAVWQQQANTNFWFNP